MRYRSEAAEHYRSMLRAGALGDAILEEPPEKEQGRRVVEERIRTSEEIMANNPPFTSQNNV